jgi:hypothetical protein
VLVLTGESQSSRPPTRSRTPVSRRGHEFAQRNSLEQWWRDIEVLAAELRERGTMMGQGVRLALRMLHLHAR